MTLNESIMEISDRNELTKSMSKNIISMREEIKCYLELQNHGTNE